MKGRDFLYALGNLELDFFLYNILSRQNINQFETMPTLTFAIKSQMIASIKTSNLIKWVSSLR
jgi:hypothetical protein